MHLLVEHFGWLPGGFLAALFIFFRYALLAGIGYLIFYRWRKQPLLHRKIQIKRPQLSAIWHDILHSVVTAVVFAAVGLGIYGLRLAGFTYVYTDVSEYGLAYLAGSFVVLVVLHDAYFYWLHRFMHHPQVFAWLHLAHHKSNNPTPWTSLAFHPLEALLEIAIIPILALFIPFHPLVLFAFATWSLVWNVIGHLGYELFPRGWVDHPVLKWLNTSTHHNMHHAYAKGNYGLYFNWWDKWMHTNHPTYEATFRAVTSAPDYTHSTSAQRVV